MHRFFPFPPVPVCSFPPIERLYSLTSYPYSAESSWGPRWPPAHGPLVAPVRRRPPKDMRCFSSVVLTALVTLTCVTALAIPDVLLDESDFEALNATLGPRSLEKRWDGVFSTCQQPGQFALTFDDGPHGYGAEITQFLNSKGVKATFFVNGNNYGCIYDRAEELQARFKAGHQIASHTWSHPNLAGLTDAQVNRQLALVRPVTSSISKMPKLTLLA